MKVPIGDLADSDLLSAGHRDGIDFPHEHDMLSRRALSPLY